MTVSLDCTASSQTGCELGGTETAQILVLDDDVAFRASLAEELQAAGFRSIEAGTVEAAEKHALREPGRLAALVLDVGLPDGDGCDLCMRLRAAGLRVPIIMLTGSDAEADVVRGLEAGANDYVAKPCSAAVLIARLRGQLRLHESSADAMFDLGPWRFHPARKLLQNTRGAKIWLTATEVSLLRFLQRSGGTASKQALLMEVWGYNSSALTHTLESHVYRLRQKIEANPHVPQLLLTTEGGYQLASA